MRINKKGKGVDQTITFATRIGKEIGEQFRQAVTKSGQNVSDVLEKFIRIWMHER